MLEREMLELAAKAWGKELHFDEDGRPFYWGLTDANGKGWNPVYWNPLTRDGDALRLAVKLGIGVKRHYYVGAYFVKCGYQGNHVAFIEPLAPDQDAATRRAIVRAAAAIGKEMK